eukprot:10683339-Ditylum_brightwellii.AAC.1
MESPKLPFLVASDNKKVGIFRSVHNFCSTLTVLEHKVATLTGLGKKAAVVKLHVFSALATVAIVTPTLSKLEICTQQEEVSLAPVPDKTATVTFNGLAIVLPTPWFCKAIFTLGEDDPFALIPVALLLAKLFDAFHINADSNYPEKALDLANDSILWAWGVGAGRVTET